MSWNYRVVRTEGGLKIFDVYYDETGRAIATHEQPTYVYGESVQELRDQLSLMLEALEKPILEESQIGSRSREGLGRE